MIQEDWMNFYKKVLTRLVEHLPGRFPKKEKEDEKDYLKAIKAKSFDVARGFLPAGVTTFVSWHSNLRQAHDHLKELKFHPLEEVRQVADTLLQNLSEKYPNSFSHKDYEEEQSYLENVIPKVSYYDFATDFGVNDFSADDSAESHRVIVLKTRCFRVPKGYGLEA